MSVSGQSQSSYDYEEKTRRIKSLLNSYYGSTGENDAPITSKPSSSSLGPKDSNVSTMTQLSSQYYPAIDAPSFDPDQYISHILKSCKLKELLGRYNDMANEIKSLDADMQMLVYENYNKFISATDTIKDMQGKVSGMAADMNNLQTTIQQVAAKSQTVNSKLQQRKDDLEHLNRVSSLVDRLQAVFELPARMKASVELGDIDDAVQSYAHVAVLLQKHGHQGAFRGVVKEVDKVVATVRNQLGARLADRTQDAAHVVTCLKGLGDSSETLQTKFLHGRYARLNKTLVEAAGVLPVLAAANIHNAADPSVTVTSVVHDMGSSVQTQDLTGMQSGGGDGAGGDDEVEGAIESERLVFWGYGDEGDAPSLCEFFKMLDERFINDILQTAVLYKQIFLPDTQHFASISETSHPPDLAHRTQQRRLNKFCKDLFTKYFRVLRRGLSDESRRLSGAALPKDTFERVIEGGSVQFKTEWGAGTIAQALTLVSADISALGPHLPSLHLHDRASELVEGAVRQHIITCFTTLYDSVVAGIDTMQNLIAKNNGSGNESAAQSEQRASILSKGLCSIEQLLHNGLKAMLQGLGAFEQHDKLVGSWRDVFVDRVQGQLQQLFLLLIDHFYQVAGLKVLTGGGKGGRGYGGSSSRGDSRYQLEKQNPLYPASPSRFKEQSPHSPSMSMKSDISEMSIANMTQFEPSTPLLNFDTPMGASDELAQSCTTPTPSAFDKAVEEEEQLKREQQLQQEQQSGDVIPPAILLLLSRLCSTMSYRSVPLVMEEVAALFPGQGGGCGQDQPPTFVAQEVVRRLSACSDRLMKAFVQAHSTHISYILKTSLQVTDWINHKQPRAPRPVCDLMLQHLKLASIEAGKLADPITETDASNADPPGYSRSSGLADASMSTGSVSSPHKPSLERNVARLFQERIDMFGALSLTQDSLVSGIISFSIKSLIESVRDLTFGRAGNQQLQVDLRYLRPHIKSFCGSEATRRLVDGLFDECANSMADRCLNPVPLSSSVLDKIVMQGSFNEAQG